MLATVTWASENTRTTEYLPGGLDERWQASGWISSMVMTLCGMG
jgi:hypothetical protein